LLSHILCKHQSQFDKTIACHGILCKYQKHARYQEGRIRYLEQELKVAGEEINSLKAGNNSSKIKDRDFSDDL
jgi:hypothetical protein